MNNLKNKKMIFFIRFLHSVITIIMLASIVYMYYFVATGDFNWLVILAVVILIGEGIALYWYNNNCPMMNVHRKYGDDKSFWDLFLPKKVIPGLIFWLKLITLTGFLLVFIRIILNVFHLL